MSNCAAISIPKSKLCIGSLKYKIEILVRAIAPPDSGSTDFGLTFTQVKTIYSGIKTVPNVAMFDQTNTEKTVSHVFYIRYLIGVTAESWVKYKNEYYDILNTENLEERNVWLILRCNKRGITTKPVNYA